MNDRKGFSLIELLAVLVIIGLILVVVLPVVSRLIMANNERRYNNYVDAIRAGTVLYADTRKDDLGGYKDVGCVLVSLDELISTNYIKKYNDDKSTCTGDVRIDNDGGNLKVSINLTCVHNDTGNVTFELQEIENTACVIYTPED